MTEPGFKTALTVSSDRIDSKRRRLHRVTCKVVSLRPLANGMLARWRRCVPEGSAGVNSRGPGALCRRHAVLLVFTEQCPEKGGSVSEESSLYCSGHALEGRRMELQCVQRGPAGAGGRWGRSGSWVRLTGWAQQGSS